VILHVGVNKSHGVGVKLGCKDRACTVKCVDLC
jgi:hypothetical protein